MHYWNRIRPAWLVPVVVFLFGCGNGDPAAPEAEVEQRFPPTVTTAAITDVTTNSATGGGEVTSDGGASVSPRGVVWSTKANPTLDDHEAKTADGVGPGSFTSSLSDLEAATTYYVRAYATNSEGTAYGNQVEFTTEFSRWTRKADFGGPIVLSAVGFSIGGNGYIGTGSEYPTVYEGFWEYDPPNGTWTQRAGFGGSGRAGAIGFSIGDKGYVGTGYDGWFHHGGSHRKDFWEYDPATDAWTQKADFGGGEREGAVGFSIGEKGYVGTGESGPDQLKDFWEYDPQANAWTQKADFGGRGRYHAVGFSMGGKDYIGTGRYYAPSAHEWFEDFWEYDPSTDTWIARADFGGEAREGAVGFSIGDKGYIGTGTGPVSKLFVDVWEYDAGTDTWTQTDDFGAGARGAAVGFSIGDRGYVGTGGTLSARFRDFWEYEPR